MFNPSRFLYHWLTEQLDTGSDGKDSRGAKIAPGVEPLVDAFVEIHADPCTPWNPAGPTDPVYHYHSDYDSTFLLHSLRDRGRILNVNM